MKKAYVITSSFYGKKFKNFKVFYSTKEQPKIFRKDGGGFSGGKHILEVLSARFKNFELILTDKQRSRIKKVGKKYFVYLTLTDVRLINSSTFEKKREIGLKLTNNYFNDLFPRFFSAREKFFAYERGIFSELLTKDFNPAILSRDDINALTAFIPKIVSFKKGRDLDVASIYKNKQSVQLLYLEKLAADFESRMKRRYGESNWQDYFKKYILLFQEGYIKKIEKTNVGIDIRFPDFCVITTDDYLDVIEIKIPSTPLLSFDKSHKNYYWSSDIAKAISQTEKYLDSITKHANDLRAILADKHGIQLRIIKPRGIIIAGNAAEFESNKEKADDFRLLNEGMKNVLIVPYDELSRRLRNMIHVITNLNSKGQKRRRRKKIGTKKKNRR